MTQTSTLSHIDIEQLVPSPNNPRKHFDQEKLKELAESMASPIGQQVPILVRIAPKHLRYDLPNGMSTYEILDGERRYRAAKLATLTKVECKIVVVDDAQALEITVIANLQRTDVTPLEEANGVASLLAAGRPVDQVAKDLGKSVAWVYLRAKLVDLSPAWRKAVDNPKHDVHVWAASMLELIARFPAAQQDELLDNYDVLNSDTTKELAKVIEVEIMRALKSAAWELDDATLVPKAGACSTCPKRTSCQQNIFDQAKGDRCTDAGCWSTKAAAFTLRKIESLHQDNGTVVLLGHRGSSDTCTLPPKLEKQIEPDWHYKKVKEGTKGAVPAVKISGAEMGTVIHVVKDKHYSDSGSSSSSSSAKGESKPIPAKERLAQFMKRRARAEILEVLTKLGGDPEKSAYQARYDKPKAAAPDVKEPGLSVLLALALAHGLPDGASTREWPGYRRFVNLSPTEITTAFWNDLRHRLVCVLGFDALGSDVSTSGAEHIAQACGIDYDAIEATVRDAMPLPRTLAEIYNEDGTARTGLTAAKPKAKPAAKKSSAKAAGKAKAARSAS